MKNYAKNQYPGNINKWEETNPKTLSVHAMAEKHADELNSHFESTGIKYEETEDAPHEFNNGNSTEGVNKVDATEKPKTPKKNTKPMVKKEPKIEEPKA